MPRTRDTSAPPRSEAASGTERPRRRMSPAERREHLLGAALQLYGERAMDDVTIDDIVAEAGVSRALFYRYFSNLREVHVAALTTVVDGLIERIALPQEGDLITQLRLGLAEFVSSVEVFASSYTALLRSGSTIATSETETLIDKVRNHVVEIVRQRVGIDDPAPLLLLTLRGWVALVETTCVTWLQTHNPPREVFEDWLTDQLITMISTTASHDPVVAEQIAPLLREIG
ncbi:TetR/AcrR family transcriptional regulator [Saccharopolyspora gloriosae]|uniref:AcrR family transcriptional regulator n=1 Tax=Saccharopolyspora gloriosae TaxID=455344 RepID=A0A840NFJ7_9PSEU|nr:TetR/AcrR family transcriptional regulator [Saccharopolyspora gloriosae]MBB5069033.1 AcrR family transcriptional regulator [Saccharopolyspora gloriosae]